MRADKIKMAVLGKEWISGSLDQKYTLSVQPVYRRIFKGKGKPQGEFEKKTVGVVS